jgi:hypothetical protein
VEIKGDIAECETYTLAMCRMNVQGYDGELLLRVRYLDSEDWGLEDGGACGRLRIGGWCIAMSFCED